MFTIRKKEKLNESVSKMVLHAPLIAKSIAAGQFVLIRVDEFGENIPLTVAQSDKTQGTITIIYQTVGTTTLKLDQKSEGEYILDVTGPLGKKTELDGYKKIIIVSGGVGCAIAYPQTSAFFENGCDVELISGFRNKELIILENEMQQIDENLKIVTDNGSNGNKGLVTDVLLEKLKNSTDYDLVIAVGPIPMMRAVCGVTKEFNIKTMVSMTAIMIDGTGMCGGCRLTVDGQVKFACTDGPDFDGHKIDFEEAIHRSNTYKEEEKQSKEKYCRLLNAVGDKSK